MVQVLQEHLDTCSHSDPPSSYLYLLIVSDNTTSATDEETLRSLRRYKEKISLPSVETDHVLCLESSDLMNIFHMQYNEKK